MQEGLHPTRRGSRCADVEQGYVGMDGRRSEARVNLKRDSSSWKDGMRKGRNEDADLCPNQLWVGPGLGRQSSATTAPWAKQTAVVRREGPAFRVCDWPVPTAQERQEGCARFMAGGVQGVQAASRMTPAASAILRGSRRGVRWPPIRCSRRCLRPTVAILEASASRSGLADGPRSGYLAGLRY